MGQGLTGVNIHYHVCEYYFQDTGAPSRQKESQQSRGLLASFYTVGTHIHELGRAPRGARRWSPPSDGQTFDRRYYRKGRGALAKVSALLQDINDAGADVIDILLGQIET